MQKQKLKLTRLPGFLLVAAIGVCFFAAVCIAAEKQRTDGVPKPTDKDKCPVCGMFITKYPDWTATILFRDGSRAFFDGPKDMYKYVLDLKRYAPSKKAEDINGIWVMDYYSISPIQAMKAWYVAGSDVFGPMGNELVPFNKESDAREFMKDHTGKKILRFSDITLDMVKALD